MAGPKDEGQELMLQGAAHQSRFENVKKWKSSPELYQVFLQIGLGG